MEWHELVDFVNDDPDAMKQFFVEYGGIIKHVSLKIVPKSNSIESDDLFLEIVTYLLTNKKKIILNFKQKCKFSTYLFLICRRYALRKVKEDSRESGYNAFAGEIPQNLVEETGSFEDWCEDMKRPLYMAIDLLDTNSQLFIKMYYFDKKPVEAIVRAFGWGSINSVYSRKNRIIEKLRKTLKRISVKQEETGCLITGNI